MFPSTRSRHQLSDGSDQKISDGFLPLAGKLALLASGVGAGIIGRARDLYYVMRSVSGMSGLYSRMITTGWRYVRMLHRRISLVPRAAVAVRGGLHQRRKASRDWAG